MGTIDFTNWTILIIDDEPDNLEVAQVALSFYGAQTHTARNGKTALEMLRVLQPTLILLDISMPQMDGWEVLRHIHATPRLESVPVIALTAFSLPSDKLRALAAGFDSHISKPFHVDQFLRDVKLGARRNTAAASETLLPANALNTTIQTIWQGQL